MCCNNSVGLRRYHRNDCSVNNHCYHNPHRIITEFAGQVQPQQPSDGRLLLAQSKSEDYPILRMRGSNRKRTGTQQTNTSLSRTTILSQFGYFLCSYERASMPVLHCSSRLRSGLGTQQPNNGLLLCALTAPLGLVGLAAGRRLLRRLLSCGFFRPTRSGVLAFARPYRSRPFRASCPSFRALSAPARSLSLAFGRLAVFISTPACDPTTFLTGCNCTLFEKGFWKFPKEEVAVQQQFTLTKRGDRLRLSLLTGMFFSLRPNF